MKRLIIILTILITGQFCFGQTGTIKGHIHDKIEEEGLAFATVFLVDQRIGAITDLNGDFILDSIPAGTYDLKIIYLGYQDSTITSIKVSKDTIIDLYIDYPPPCKYDQVDKNCPICKKNDKVIPIIYGLPGEELMKESKKGKVRLGGCMVTGCDPSWYCKRDNNEF